MANVQALEALADPTRRRLFDRLRQGACSVKELVQTVKPLTQPVVYTEKDLHVRQFTGSRTSRRRKGEGQAA